MAFLISWQKLLVIAISISTHSHLPLDQFVSCSKVEEQNICSAGTRGHLRGQQSQLCNATYLESHCHDLETSWCFLCFSPHSSFFILLFFANRTAVFISGFLHRLKNPQ